MRDMSVQQNVDFNFVDASILSKRSEKVICQFNDTSAEDKKRFFFRKSNIFHKYVSNFNAHLSS